MVIRYSVSTIVTLNVNRTSVALSNILHVKIKLTLE